MARSRRTKVAPEDKLRVVLSVLAGEMSCREGARRVGVSADSVVKWKHQFLRPAVSGFTRFLVARRARKARPNNGGCRWKTSSSNWRWQKPRSSCGSGSAARQWPIRSLPRPRSPKRSSGSAGFEVLRTGRHPRRHLSTATGPVTPRQPSQGAVAGAEGRSHRGASREIRRGVAGVGVSEDRRLDAC